MRACRMSLPHRPLYYFIADLIVAEGNFGKKKHKNQGRFTFTNTDPELIKLVYTFLIKSLKIPSDKIYIYITYNTEVTDLDQNQIKDFWKKTLGINEEKIRIYPYRRKVKQIRKRNNYGICQIRINDKKLRRKIENFIKEIITNVKLAVGEGHIESP